MDFPQPRLPLPPPALVELRGVTKRFGDRVAVEALDLAVERGACFGLLGPNGAGKTTALRMVYGVTRPTAGLVRVFGLDVARAPRAVRSRLGVTLQENVLLEALSPLENLRTFGRYHLLREPELSRRALELIELFALGSHARAPVKVLSGGMQRRLAIGLSLMNRPELLILDEPTTGLDPQVRLALWSRVRDLRAGGTTILLTTHYMDEAERLCDRIAILAAGRLRAEGSPAELIRAHLAPEALELDVDAAAEAALFSGAATPVRRIRAGRRLFVYDTDVRPHVERIRRADGGERRPLVARPTNLEDVFLALTGTGLDAAPARGASPVITLRAVSLPHAFAVWQRNAAMYRRTWKLNLLPNFFEPVLYLVSIGIGVGSYVTEMGGTSYVAFLAPGLIAVAAMNGASFEVTYNTFVRLHYEKTYDSMLTTPIQPEDVLVGEVLWAVTRACIYGGCFFIVLAAVGLAPLPRALLALPLLPLAGCLFAAIGIAFSLHVVTIDLFNFYFTLFLTPLFLFSDIFFPLNDRLSGAWLWLAEALPLLHPVRLARAAFRGEASAVLIWDLVYILAVSALLLAFAARSARRRLTS